MTGAWIMFCRDGEVVVDVVIGSQTQQTYPRRLEYITPHHGFVSAEEVIDMRLPDTRKEADELNKTLMLAAISVLQDIHLGATFDISSGMWHVSEELLNASARALAAFEDKEGE